MSAPALGQHGTQDRAHDGDDRDEASQQTADERDELAHGVTPLFGGPLSVEEGPRRRSAADDGCSVGGTCARLEGFVVEELSFRCDASSRPWTARWWAHARSLRA